jgi:hypothetical protein
MRLDQFFDTVKELTPKQRALIVDQAMLLLEGFYVHLPLKRAMYAVDPLQRLRLLRHRLPQCKSDRDFHAEMTDIFTSLHDLHTTYLLPAPFKYAYAWLPFKVEAYWDGNRRKYLVARVADWFTRGTFRKGVENLAAQSMTDLAERGSLGVRELQPPLQLGLQDAIFGGQIFNPRQQLLVHHPRDEGQNARPIHSSSTPADSQLLAQKIVASATRRGYAENGQLTVFSTVLIF